MKKLTLAILLSLVLAFAANVMSNAAEVEMMTDKFLRVHVIANSDSEEDQELKLKVRDAVLEAAGEFLLDCADKDGAMELILKNMPMLQSAAANEISRSGYDYAVKCTLAKETFDTRVYDDFTLPAGEYDSLCIRIGKAEGKNWWCVCYPQLCIGAVTKIDDSGILTDGELRIVKEPQTVRYKLWCYEVIKKLKLLFN